MDIKFEISKVHPEPGDILIINLRERPLQKNYDQFMDETQSILPDGVGAILTYPGCDINIINNEINQIQLFKE